MPSISHLTLLEADGLISLSQVNPELVYLFRHALVQEAAYQSLVRLDRKALHLAVGEILEEYYRETPEKYAAILAQHFSRGGDELHALHYYKLAAEDASRRYANAEAVMHYNHALLIATNPNIPEPIPPQLWMDLYMGLGYAYQRMLQYDLALQTFKSLEEQGRQSGESRLELESILSQAVIYATLTPKFNPQEGESFAIRALELANRLDDKPSHARGLWLLMLNSYFSNEIENAIQYGLEAIEFSRRYELREQLALLLNDMASFIYFITGEFETAIESLLEAREIFISTDNLPMLTDNLTNLAQYHFFLGELDLASKELEDAHRINLETGNLWGQAFDLCAIGITKLEQLSINSALEALVQADNLSTLSGISFAKVLSNLYLAALYNRIGDGTLGKHYAEVGLKAGEGQASLFQVYGYSVQASAEILLGEYQQAEDSLSKAKAAAQTTGGYLDGLLYLSNYLFAYCDYHLAVNQPELVLEFTSGFLNHPHFQKGIAWLPYYFYYHARALYELEQSDQAAQLLAQAEPTARRLNLRGILWNIYALQAKIQAQTGNLTRVEEYTLQAREIIDEIVASAGNSGLGEKFLSQPDVKAIYSHPGTVYNGLGGKSQ